MMKWTIAWLVWATLFLLPLLGYAEPQPSGSTTTNQNASAQSDHIELGVGLIGGLGWITHGGADATTQFAQSVPKRGQTFGLQVNVVPNERFAPRLELLYMTKGADVETLEGMPSGTLNAAYWGGALVLDINFFVRDKLRPYALGGLEVGYIQHFEHIGYISGINTDLKDGATTLDVGLLAGVGIGWRAAPRHELMFETRLDIGLRTVDSSEGNDNEVLNRSLMFMLGYRFSVFPSI